MLHCEVEHELPGAQAVPIDYLVCNAVARWQRQQPTGSSEELTLYPHTSNFRSAMHRVFVYGTLKRGQPNHPLILNPEFGTAKYIGPARTVEKFPLVVASECNIPFLLFAPGKGNVSYWWVWAPLRDWWVECHGATSVVCLSVWPSMHNLNLFSLDIL